MAKDDKKRKRDPGATGAFPGSRMARDFVPQDSIKVNPLLPGGFTPAGGDTVQTEDGQARRGRGANRVIERIRRRIRRR